MSFLKRLYLTYTKENPETGEVYSGLTSGIQEEDTPEIKMIQRILRKRDSSHHKSEDGFQDAQLDKSSDDYEAVRGREQMLINYHGGAQSEGGTSGNKVNGISHRNPKRNKYLEAAVKLFGGLSILFVIILFIRAFN
jgi:hypothetical protein